MLGDVGCVITGQTGEIAPLDRRLYDLRNATGTVSSLPLIAASIMSKKLAEGISGLVLDVKVGDGAFLPEEERAFELARTMVALGENRGVRTVALLTAMDRPLGRAIGNALEVREALECLGGGGPDELRELTLAQAAEMAVVGGAHPDRASARAAAERALEDGRALQRFARMVEAQGGDPTCVAEPERLPEARVVAECGAEPAGVVTAVAPRDLRWMVVELGGGRRALGEPIDPAVGFGRPRGSRRGGGAAGGGARAGRGERRARLPCPARRDHDRGRGRTPATAALPPGQLRGSREALSAGRSVREGPELDAFLGQSRGQLLRAVREGAERDPAFGTGLRRGRNDFDGDAPLARGVLGPERLVGRLEGEDERVRGFTHRPGSGVPPNGLSSPIRGRRKIPRPESSHTSVGSVPGM